MARCAGTTMALTLALATAGIAAAPPPTARPPARVGACAFITVRRVSQRLEDETGHVIPDSGSAVALADGVYGVSYDEVPAVNRARRGDRVMTCLTRLPRHCPPGDDRGRWYTTTDLRTDEAWMLPDAEHQCGGA